MANVSQLIKKDNTQVGGYKKVFPKTYFGNIVDEQSGLSLPDVLSGFNMYFLDYVGNASETRLQVPSFLRKTGLWITYVMYDKTIIVEWYASDDISDDAFREDSNWRKGNNILVGDITISSNGNWIINGVDSGIKAQGERGITPILRVNNNKLEVSYTNGASFNVLSDYIAAWFRWVDIGNGVGKIQISRDNSSWSDLSPEFTNNLKIADYVSSVGELPSGVALGTIYGVGPTYDSSDTSHTNPIYTLYVYTSDGWLDNGHFTSIAAGIVQTIGGNENVVMSQKAVCDAVGLNEYPTFSASEAYSAGDVVNYNGKLYKFTADHATGAWIGTDVEPYNLKKDIEERYGTYTDNPEFIRAYTDAEGKFLWGIRIDGSIEWAKGVPTPIQNALKELADKIKVGGDKIEEVETALNEKIEALQDAIDVINASLKPLTDTFSFQDNEEFAHVIIDADGKVLFGIKTDGSPYYPHNEMYHVEQNEEFIHTVVDSEGRLLFGIYRDSGKPYFPLNEMYHVIQNEEYFAAWLDTDDKVLLGIKRDGELIGNIRDVNVLKDTIIEIQKEIGKLSKTDVIARNSSRFPAVMSACRYKGGTHDFQMCIITDSHAEELAVQNAVSLCNNIDVIDSIIHCGDITGYTYDKSQVSTFMNDIKKCTKPWLIVIGNHDVGNTMYVHYGATHDEAYESFIKPMVTNNILREGEYQAGKSYYYHDFPSRKVRVIVIYDYDNPLDIADNDYWDTIEYDPSIPKVIPGNKYTVGDKINCGGFVDKSFVCKKEVKTIDDSYATSNTMPTYKVGRAVVCIGKEQAQWLVSTLKNTPSEYGIIIATHSPAMLNSTNQTQYNFAIDTPKTGKGEGMNAMSTDLLPEIVDAFINKSAKQIHVKMKSGDWHDSDASYLNTITGSDGEKYAYDLDVDFTDRNDCYFAGYVGGHAHDDLIYKHDSYKGQYSVNPVCAITEQANRRHADIIDVREDSLCYDALTCFSCSKGRIALSRLGNTLSINGKHRDIEIINTNI